MLNNIRHYRSSAVIPAAEQTDKVRLSFLEWLASEDETRQQKYTTYREYYDGEHETMLSARMQQYLQVADNQEFNVNYCPIVVDSVAERLIVTGFEADDQDEQLWDWWQQNRMDGQQRVVHNSAGRDGDSYIMVDWDGDKNIPRFIPQMAYDGHSGVKVHYSKEHYNKIEFATKRWRIEQGGDAGYVRRLNVYYPNRIEKFISDGRTNEGNWREYIDEDEETHIKWWTDNGLETGEPLGVPIAPFNANERGWNFGKSDLHDVIPLQNALNKSMIDLLAAADTTGFRIYKMIGDDPSNVTIAPGMWVYSLKPSSGEDSASIDYIPGEDVTPMIALKDSVAAEIAKISRTPLSYFQLTGQVAAEGTLKQQESGLVAKVVDRQVSFGNSWENVLYLARQLNNAFGSGPELDTDQEISTRWKDPETRNELPHWDAMQKKYDALQLPPIARLRDSGYTDEDIQQIIEDSIRGEEQLLGADIIPPVGQ